DLGLDPHTLLPSQRIDPPVGRPGTPPLPPAYPRTGQGGEPRLNLPDAITGNPADPRYPYRQPPPAPPPGGAPPGPPAPAPPDLASTPQQTHGPIICLRHMRVRDETPARHRSAAGRVPDRGYRPGAARPN